eukprot:scaffold170837_cov33-Tisochrysis_lutea.AAC.2
MAQTIRRPRGGRIVYHWGADCGGPLGRAAQLAPDFSHLAPTPNAHSLKRNQCSLSMRVEPSERRAHCLSLAVSVEVRRPIGLSLAEGKHLGKNIVAARRTATPRESQRDESLAPLPGPRESEGVRGIGSGECVDRSSRQGIRPAVRRTRNVVIVDRSTQCFGESLRTARSLTLQRCRLASHNLAAHLPH